MSDDPTWRGLARGLLVLGVLWWSWVGYAWLTSVVDPRKGRPASSCSAPWPPSSSCRSASPGPSATWASPSPSSTGSSGPPRSASSGSPGGNDAELRRSVIGLGVGTAVGVALLVVASFLGLALLAAMWWAYFDVVAFAAVRPPDGRDSRQGAERARPRPLLLPGFPLVASIVLVALGLKKTLAHVEDPLETVPAFALVGGAALYLLGHVAFRLRNTRSINKQRLVVGVALIALLPVATPVAAVTVLAGVALVLCRLIAYEAIRFAEGRNRVRHQLAAEPPSR